MYKTFTLPLKSAIFSLAALFILTACGGFTLDLNLPTNSDCIANPFESECDNDKGIAEYRKFIIDDCANNPEKANTVLCTAAEATTNPPSDDENIAGGGAEDVVKEVAGNTPKDIKIKPELNKNSFTKTDKEKGETTTLEIVDLCTNPATADDKQCTPAVIDCINNPFSGSCQGDNVLGNFVRDDVTVSKAVVLQDKRAEDCRTGSIDRALCQNLNVQKQRCAGAAFSTDKICTSVAYSVCKADAFDPLCGEKEDFQGVYFNERSNVCFEDPNNPHCKGASGHIAVVCSEYPFDRLCTGNTDYDDARADACEANPTISSSCPVVDVCLDNPFGPTCADSDYNNARKDLAKTCAIQAVTGAVTTACDTIITEAGPCFKNPFDTDCDSNPAVRTYIAQLRSSRVALCKNSTGLFDHLIAPLCTGAPVAKSVCRIDPFNTACIGDNNYDNSRLSACRDGSASAGQCGNIITGVCRDNPFDALCGGGYTGDRLSACRDGTANAGQCGNIIAGVCRDDPFDALCGNGYTDARESACRDGTASAGQCGNIVAGVCGSNPFDTLCGGGYTNARLSACRDGTANAGQCGNIIASVCRDNPFDTLCGGGYTNARLSACRDGTASAGQCGGIITGVCGDNPFDSLCGNGYTQNRRSLCTDNPFATRCAGAGYNDLRVSFCENNAGNPACPRPQPTSNRVTTADWLASFDTPLVTQSSIRLQNNGYRHWNQFLKSTRAGLDTSGLEVLSLTSTSFANATFDGQSLGGDALGGAYSLRTYLNGLINNFASVHSDTDLGAPISEAAGTQLIWHGAFQYAMRNYSGNGRGYDSHTQDFDLEINFGTGNKVGTVEAFVKNKKSMFDNSYIHLKGEFDANGVIDGTALGGFFRDHDRLGIINNGSFSYTHGLLSGLIGQKGAVGVIQGNTGAAGFVATPNARFNPNVRHSDWANSFDLGVLHNFASYDNARGTEDLPVSYDNAQGTKGLPAFFVRGDETGIHSRLNSLSGVNFAPTFLENTLDFSDINANLDSTDKVSYIATAESSGRGNRFSGRLGHAAGIWPTTDLGLPLEIRPADAHGRAHKATWGGKLGLIVNAKLIGNSGAGSGLIPTRDIGLVVDYTNQTIHNTSTINGAHQVVLNGRWTNNADNSQNGVINGDITYNAAPADTDSTAYAGVVKGIIGQEGAVGAFVRDGTDFDYVGGFIAHPSAVFVPTPVADITPNRVTTADWVASFETAPLTAPISYGGQFLQGNETKLNPGALFPDAEGIRSKTFANAGYGHIDFNTDAAGGYSYFQGYTGRSSTTHYYAGILANTDLGAPLTQTSGSLYWKGSASYHHRRPGSGTGADRSMILKISFGDGGQGNAGKVNSTINADLFESRFDLEGVFNHQGVISGTATLIHNETATFGSLWAASNRYAGTQISGVLSGLIGQEGAVGAFYSKRKASDTGKGIFGGGFIVAPSFVDVTPPASASDRVTTADSLASFSSGLVATPSYRNKNYFLKATQTGLNTGEYTNLGSKPIVYSLTLAEVTRNGQTSDGVAFFKGGVEVSNTRELELGGYAYAGILSDTDLGAPLTSSSGTASWKGRLVAEFNNKNTVKFIRRNLTLEVSFDNAGSGNAGKITSIINATTDTEFEIDGVFNSQGVMSGAVSTIHALPFPDGSLSDNRYINRGLLTGLIGQEGAVGAFVSPPHIRSGFVGGFVAAPDFVYVRPADTTPNLVTRADWLEASFETAPALIADANTNHFVQLPDEFIGVTLGGRANIFAYRSNFWNKTIHFMTLDDDVQTGIWNTPFALAFAQAFRGDVDDASNSYFYAGILLKDMDLGAPLSETTGTATWSGLFKAASADGNKGAFVSRDFTLDITFNTTGGDISTVVSGETEDYFELDGTFNDRGVISGTANHVYYENGRIGEVTGDILNSGPVTGLIGQEGAVGVFVSNRQTGPSAGSGFAGGFVARPPSE